MKTSERTEETQASEPETALTVHLSAGTMRQLEETADALGVSAEQLARFAIADMLDGPDDDFKKVADYVFEKNAELYRRLA
ncbi:MAG: DNA-binding protein [Chloroflexia bacterium]